MYATCCTELISAELKLSLISGWKVKRRKSYEENFSLNCEAAMGPEIGFFLIVIILQLYLICEDKEIIEVAV